MALRSRSARASASSHRRGEVDGQSARERDRRRRRAFRGRSGTAARWSCPTRTARSARRTSPRRHLEVDRLSSTSWSPKHLRRPVTSARAACGPPERGGRELSGRHSGPTSSRARTARWRGRGRSPSRSTAASMYSSMNSWLKAAISCASRNSSVTRISEASEVSLTRLMKVFDSGGTDTRAACGRMIRRSVVAAATSRSCAPASHWPFGHGQDRRPDHLGRIAADVERERDDRARPRV